jgi:hypothetical protein
MAEVLVLSAAGLSPAILPSMAMRPRARRIMTTLKDFRKGLRQ